MTNLKIPKIYNFFLIFSFFINLHADAQCINGDCENGVGLAKMGSGTYSGNFQNSLPNGKGVFLHSAIRGRSLDSVRDEGNFIDGVFVNGQRNVLFNWELVFDTEANAYLGTKGHHKRDGYWMVQKSVEKPIITYPEERNVTISLSGKKEKSLKAYHYYGVNSDDNIMWIGKLKSGVPDGEGQITIVGGGWNKEFTIRFDKGVPYGDIKINRWDIWERKYYVSSLTLRNGLVDEQVIIMGDDTLRKQLNVSFFYALENGMIGDPSGYFTKRAKDGSLYKGMMEKGLYNGFGKLEYSNGATYTGYFYKNLRHGQGILVTANGDRDSGLYQLNKLLVGTTSSSGGKPKTFPICLEGNCTDGIGKASYILSPNDTLSDLYEGSFVNRLPSGYGVKNYRRGTYSYSKTGLFSAGYLSGAAEIISNKGIIRKIKGEFLNDTLKAGTIDYFDGSSFEAKAYIYSHSIYLTMKPVVFGINDKKELGGEGVYRSATGMVLTGKFNPFNNTLLQGTYTNAAGIVIKNFGVQSNDYENMRIPSVAFDVDRIDNYVKDIVARIRYNEELKIQAQKEYAIKAERDRLFSEQYNKPDNFRNETGYITCSACKGAGKFVYTNTFGGNVVREEMDGKGGWKIVEYERTGRTYTQKVTCDACNGKGGFKVVKKVYTGPAY